MRTTVQIDDQLLSEAKQYAAQTGRTLEAVIEDALREALAHTDTPRPQTRIPLQTFKGRGVQPGVDLDDTSSLFDLIERNDGPA